MGNNQSSMVTDDSTYLALSPSPFVSLANRPAIAKSLTNQNYGTRSSSQQLSIRNSRPTIDSNKRECAASTSKNGEQPHQQCVFPKDKCHKHHECASKNSGQQCWENSHDHSTECNDIAASQRCIHKASTQATCDTDIQRNHVLNPSTDIRRNHALNPSADIWRNHVLNPSTNIQRNHVLNPSADIAAELHHHSLNAKNMSHISSDTYPKLNNLGEISDRLNASCCPRNEKIVDINKPTRKRTSLKEVDLNHQLLLTQSFLGEMTEVDQSNESYNPEDVLVERGGSFGPKAFRHEDKQKTGENGMEGPRNEYRSANSTGQLEDHDGALNSLRAKVIDAQREDGHSEDRAGQLEVASGAFYSVATNESHVDSHYSTFPPPTTNRNASSSEIKTSSPQVYVDPRTREFHFLVFGSVNGEETSMIGGSGKFSAKFPSNVSGNFMNSSAFSLATEPFSNVASMESLDHTNSDFTPNDSCNCVVGRLGPFDSFDCSSERLSLSQDLGIYCSESTPNHDMGWQSIESYEKTMKELDCQKAGPDKSVVCQNSQMISRKSFSNCESCDDTLGSKLMPSFGNSGSVCQFCCNHSQFFAAETNSFSAALVSMDESKNSCDSWFDSCKGAEMLQTTGPIFVDFSDDSQNLYNSREPCEQFLCNCSQNEIEFTRCSSVPGICDNVDDCQVATEDFGLNQKPQSSQFKQKFGRQCSDICMNITQTQMSAESEIRGTDTKEFNYCSSYKIAKNVEECNQKKKITAAGNVCRLDNHVSLMETDPESSCVKANRSNNPVQFKKEQPESNNSLPVKTDVQQTMNDPANYECVTNGNSHDGGHQARQLDHPSLPVVRHSTDSSGIGEPHNTEMRPEVRNSETAENVEERTRDSHGRDDEEYNELCRMRLSHSHSQSCDCNNPFRQNYVAYLCCASEDLSDFGLTFHHMLETWGYRIFIAPRDLELTGAKYDNMTRWLEDRCNGKIIVVLSKNYGKSDECLFLTYFAKALDPDSKKRNIIPVMIDRNLELPNVLIGLSIIKYNYDTKCGWLKKKLVNAIAA